MILMMKCLFSVDDDFLQRSHKIISSATSAYYVDDAEDARVENASLSDTVPRFSLQFLFVAHLS